MIVKIFVVYWTFLLVVHGFIKTIGFMTCSVNAAKIFLVWKSVLCVQTRWLAKEFIPLELFHILSHYNHNINMLLDQHKVAHSHEVQRKLYLILISIFFKYSALLNPYFVGLPFAAITESSLLGYVSTSFEHLELEIFAHSFLQNSSSSVRLDKECLWTALF